VGLKQQAKRRLPVADPTSDLNPLDQLAEEFVERYRLGERPPLSEYVGRHPELASEIRDLFPGLVLMEGIRPEAGEATGAYAETVPSGIKLERLGDYRILREVGRGGMGIVYEAEQESLDRRVALKVLPGQMLLDPYRLQRFEREARSAAKLHHTNIVPVYGVGCNDGLHYYVMQFIQGQGLDQVLDELNRLRRCKNKVPAGTSKSGGASAADVAQALLAGKSQANSQRSGSDEALPPTISREFAASTDSSIHLPGHAPASTLSDTGRPYWQSVAHVGIQVADALAHAHAQGTLHRDIKPSNLLLDGQGNVWVTDFGLAKASADADNLTHTGDIVGTLRYMAPERYQGQSDIRGDIYSLGLTLYEMLVLRPAFRATDRNKLIQQVMHDQPELPGKLNSAVPRDLETIVLKAIDRDPARRYQTAAELAADLQRFVEDRPIQARRVNVPEQFWRWCRRNPVIASLAAALVLVVLVGFAGVAWKWREAERQKTIAQAAEQTATRQREIAVEQADRSRHLLYISEMNLAQQAWEAGDTGRARGLLERQWPQAGQEDLRGFEWRYLWGLCRDGSRQTLPHTERVQTVAFSPDGKVLATGGWHSVRFWDVATRRCVRLELVSLVMSVAVAPDGKTLAILESWNTGVHLWDMAARCELPTLPHPTEVKAMAFGHDNLLAAGCMDGTIHFWDVTARREVSPPLEGHDGSVAQVAFSPDGKILASSGADGNVRLWDVAARRLIHTLQGHRAWVNSLAFSPDGKLLASAGNDATVRLWDTAAGQPVKKLWSPRTALTLVECYTPLGSVAFSHDGKTLATGGGDGTIRMWNVETKEVMALLRGHTEAVRAVAFAPDGQSLVSGSEDGTVKMWDVVPAPDPNILTGHKSNLSALAFSHDGKTLAVADTLDQTVKLWDLASRNVAVLEGHTAHLWSLAFAPGGQTLASSGNDHTVRLWDASSKKQLGAELQTPDDNAGSVAFSPDGKLLAAACLSNTVRVWDIASRRQVAQLSEGYDYRVQFSPDGTLLAANEAMAVKLWDVATWQSAGDLAGHTGEVHTFAFAPDGRTLALGAADGTLYLWDMTKKQLVASRKAHTSNIETVAFAPDGRRLATGGADSTIKLWDIALFQELATLIGHNGPVNSVAFSPDGNTLASAAADATVRLWQAPHLPAVLQQQAESSIAPPDETIHPFSLRLFGTARATWTPEGNVQRVAVSAVDGTRWHAKLAKRFDDLQEGATYTIRFRAKADAPRPMTLCGLIGESDYHGIGLDEEVSLTETWQEYAYAFQAKDLAARNIIEMQLGNQTGTVWIADFTVRKRAK